MNTPKVLSFDLDETLIHSEGLRITGEFIIRFTQALSPKYGLRKVFRLIQAINKEAKTTSSGIIISEKYAKHATDILDLPSTQHGKDLLESIFTQVFEAILPEFHAYPDAVEFLNQHQTWKKYLTTNPAWPLSIAHIRLQHCGIDASQFESISNYDEYTCGKPHTRFYKEWLQKNDLIASEVLHIGNDIKNDGAARNCGVPVYIIQNSNNEERAFQVPAKNKSQAPMWIGTWDQLKKLLSNSESN